MNTNTTILTEAFVHKIIMEIIDKLYEKCQYITEKYPNQIEIDAQKLRQLDVTVYYYPIIIPNKNYILKHKIRFSKTLNCFHTVLTNYLTPAMIQLYDECKTVSNNVRAFDVIIRIKASMMSLSYYYKHLNRILKYDLIADIHQTQNDTKIDFDYSKSIDNNINYLLISHRAYHVWKITN